MELPTTEEIESAQNLLKEEGIYNQSQTFQIYVTSDGNPRFLGAYFRDRPGAASDTLAGLVAEERRIHRTHDPANRLRVEAEKLGYQLIRKP